LTDVVQSPAPSTPPPQTVDAPLFKQQDYTEANERIAAEADPDHKALERLEKLPAEEAARAAARIQRKRREREGVADPIIERKYAEPLKLDRDDENATWQGTKSLDEASKDLSFSRLMDRGSEFLNNGYSPDQAVAAVNAELAFGKPSEQPLSKIGMLREDGSVVQEISDADGPILGLDPSIAIKNPKDAARFVGRYRDAVAAQQQQLLDEINQREATQQKEAEQQQLQAAEAEHAKLEQQKRAEESKQHEAARRLVPRRSSSTTHFRRGKIGPRVSPSSWTSKSWPIPASQILRATMRS
jgi:hypothetical protein